MNLKNEVYEHYEKMPKAKGFWSQGGDFPQYHGKEFEILHRGEQQVDYYEPCWKIRFENGHEMWAYADEIFLPEMKDNGYEGE